MCLFRDPHYPESPRPWGLLWTVTVPQTFLACNDLASFGEVLGSMSVSWDLLVFLMIKTGVMGQGEEGHTGEGPFLSHHAKDTYSRRDLPLLMLTSTIRLRVTPVIFLCCAVTLFRIARLCSLEEVTVRIPHFGSGKLCSLSLRKEDLPQLFGILRYGRFFSSLAFICSIICLHHYGLKGIHSYSGL